MLKRKKAIAAVIVGLSVVSASTPALAAGKSVTVNMNNKGNGVYIWKLSEQIFPGCKLPEIPGIEFPENPKPELPDVNPGIPDIKPEIPDTEKPEQKPETPAPEQPDQKPEGGKPEQPNQKPGTEDNSFAMQVINLVNKERAKEGLPALQYDASVAEAALVRAKETEISFSHTRPNGASFTTALKESGVSYRGAGENIAWGQKSPEAVMKAWMESPGHRANIMSEKYTKMGVGHYQNSKGVNYWTQLFIY